MNTGPFRMEDIAGFLRLASSEKWMADRWEFEFLLSVFPQGSFTARTENGEPAGYVTSICHQRSGWIGNLIVEDRYRGRGIGEKLFTAALESLRFAGVSIFWLTASKTGLPLYEKFGFTAIDTIIRWSGEGKQRHAMEGLRSIRNRLNFPGADLDSLAWGDHREALLAATVGRGRLLQDESGFISLQPCGASVQFGPFSADDPAAAEHLFASAYKTVSLGTKVFVDAPASNRAALKMFNRKKMRIAGSTKLMYAGEKPHYRPELIYGLATMGSCG